jgi:hypothetical protein
MPAAKRARSLIVGHLDWLDQQISPHLLFKAILEVGGWSVSKGRALIANGVLEGFNDGARVKVTARSIARYWIALALLTHPLNGPSRKIRQPSARFQKQPRARTPGEIEGLRKGNAARHAAKLRREAKRREARV